MKKWCKKEFVLIYQMIKYGKLKLIKSIHWLYFSFGDFNFIKLILTGDSNGGSRVALFVIKLASRWCWRNAIVGPRTTVSGTLAIRDILCQDFDISFALPHEMINRLVNAKGSLIAICMRLENPNMNNPISRIKLKWAQHNEKASLRNPVTSVRFSGQPECRAEQTWSDNFIIRCLGVIRVSRTFFP